MTSSSSAPRPVAAAAALVLALAWGPAAVSAAGCNPASQVCDYDELQEEMRRAANRGSAFIQASQVLELEYGELQEEMRRAANRGSAFIQAKRSQKEHSKKQRRAVMKERVAAYDAEVQKQVDALVQDHGTRRVTHSRRAAVTFKDGSVAKMERVTVTPGAAEQASPP
mmetsp:Transcript_38202/g.79823  ORF Transcript_38202/g.79823 Transcript_38202/m.79823 type:complete len:168 (+) Transcript_38202:156-659(+)